MDKSNKKVLTILILLFSLIFIFNACGKREENDKTGDDSVIETVSDGIKFKYDVLNVIIGEEKYLIVEVDYDKDKIIEFSSSDEGIAAIDKTTGRLEGLSVGVATITAKYGDKQDSCTVNVSLGDYLPSLIFNAIPNTDLTVVKGNAIDFSCGILFNGKTFNDVDVEFVIDDERIGKVENGIFTALNEGKCKVYVNAAWRNTESVFLKSEIVVRVVADVELYINDGSTRFVMNNIAKVGDDEYENFTSFIVTAKEDGKNVDFEVQVESGNDIVIYDEVAKKLRVKDEKTGSAVIVVRFTDKTGVVHSIKAYVEVYLSAPDNSGYFNPEWII